MGHLELTGVLELVEVGLQIEGLLQVLQELALERHDLLDVAEERVDLRARQERLLLQRLQVVLQQVVQVLEQKALKFLSGFRKCGLP